MSEERRRLCFGWPEGSCSNLEDYELTISAGGVDRTIPICADCTERVLQSIVDTQVERHGEEE